MEIIVIGLILLVGAGAIWYFNRSAKSFDVNQDGKVDTKDAVAAVENTVAGVKETADVNKDGAVNTEDVKVAVAKTKAAVKKTATKAKAAAKTTTTTRGRKPKTAK